jgi:hypothetical protein
MVDWNRKFKAEYDYARAWLNNADNFSEEWRPLIKRLRRLMSDEGFESGEARSLSQLRKQVKQGKKKLLLHSTVTEDQGILTAVGAWTDDAGGAVDANAKMRAAALKLLRHIYLLNRFGNRKVWVLSLPTDFIDWPSDDLNARAGTQIAARLLLRSKDEHFSSDQKKYLANSTQQALAWCQKTGIVLARAAKAEAQGSEQNVAALNLVKRWFADPSTSINELNTSIATLSQGFKDIIALLNKGQFILTDWVPFRKAQAQDEIDFLNAEAFTFRSRGEGLDVVYIEKNFFVENAGNVLPGQKNWTRIVVHELTHLACGTEDVVKGQARYAWYGIGPHAGFTGAEAARNADSWAFFCADCAGVLTDGERNSALKII